LYIGISLITENSLFQMQTGSAVNAKIVERLYTEPWQVLQGTLVWVSQCMVWLCCWQGHLCLGRL